MPGKSQTKLILSALVILLLFPAVICLSSFFGARKYYIGAMLIAFISIILFLFSFEGRKPRADELTALSVMIAVCTISRIIFIALPFVKPLPALVIITAAAFGANAGFVCGSVSMLVSNFVFGQGPWTVWQMLSMGLLGFISGLVFCNHKKLQNPIYLSMFSFLVQVAVTGPVLDLSGLFFASTGAKTSPAAALLIAGLPLNALQGAVTVIFILLLFKPMSEKLERIKTKYGMMNYEV